METGLLQKTAFPSRTHTFHTRETVLQNSWPSAATDLEDLLARDQLLGDDAGDGEHGQAAIVDLLRGDRLERRGVGGLEPKRIEAEVACTPRGEGQGGWTTRTSENQGRQDTKSHGHEKSLCPGTTPLSLKPPLTVDVVGLEGRQALGLARGLPVLP
jgi:hypothetical protein